MLLNKDCSCAANWEDSAEIRRGRGKPYPPSLLPLKVNTFFTRDAYHAYHVIKQVEVFFFIVVTKVNTPGIVD